MAVRDRLACLPHCVGEHRELAAGGDPGIELAQAAGGAVARIGEKLEAGFHLRCVQGQEVGFGHEHLTADFDPRRSRATQLVGNGGDGADVGGDILALDAVAAGCRLCQHPVLKRKVDRQPVDLRLPDHGQRGVGGQAEEPAGAGDKLIELQQTESIVERQHRHPMAQLGKAAGRGCAHAQGRRIGIHQIREAGFDLPVPLTQGIVAGIGNFGGVMAVIGEIMPRDLLGQLGHFGPCLGPGHAPRPSRASAAARAAGVMVSPASIRAISSRRCSASNGVTVVAVRSWACCLATRRCAAPRAAT